jgi:alginate O-acetyltransferase complex protein AlgI
MIFTTATFPLFLALVFSLYWALKDNSRQKVLLLISGYVFYGWWDYRFCSLLLASSLTDYTLGRLLARAERKPVRRFLLTASCVFNLGLLGLFKYWNFFAGSWIDLFQMLGWRLDFPTVEIILPVGISFYTFQSMSYIIDVYRRKVEPSRSLLDYMVFVAFFPQLLAGPIERAANLLPQIQAPRRFDYAAAVDGLRLILWGFVKKIAIADNLAVCVDQAFSNPEGFDGLHLSFGVVCFAFQIYGDFSAYSDIARGTARLFGVKLMRNFNSPYFSQSVAEFWRRWHISLSTWFRDYLYIPLGGSRVTQARLVFNILATFVVSGLWHGAAWTYAAWGALNGLGIVSSALRRSQRARAEVALRGPGLLPSPRATLSMLRTFSFICLTWVFFRARTFRDAGLILSRIFSRHFLQHGSRGFDTFVTTKGLCLLIFVFVAVEWVWEEQLHLIRWERLPVLGRWFAYTCAIWITLYLGPLHSGTFIYFQF